MLRLYLSCLHCSNLHLVFTNKTGELTTLTKKQGLLVSYAKQSLFPDNHYGHNEFAELQIGNISEAGEKEA